MPWLLSERRGLVSVGFLPVLVNTIRLALSIRSMDFVIIEGLRNIERQRKLIITGASRTYEVNHV